MAKVSIIIPTYNRCELLVNRALPSVQNQRGAHELEILVVGDGTDVETEMAMDDVMAMDPRVKFWNIPHQEYPEEKPGLKWGLIGLEARNFGHDQATGRYVGGLDDDDEFTTDHVQVLVQALEWNDVDLAYGRSRKFLHDGGSHLVGTKDFGYANLCDGAAIWKRELGYRYDPDGPNVRGLPEDGDLWERMKADGVRTWFVPQVVHHYYPNPDGFSA
jgi:glycosyltransferase involved in cell wall biosynthesis